MEKFTDLEKIEAKNRCVEEVATEEREKEAKKSLWDDFWKTPFRGAKKPNVVLKRNFAKHFKSAYYVSRTR